MQKKDKPAHLIHGELTNRILKTFFQVYNELGTGFLESIYRVAFARALRDSGLQVEPEWPIEVFFRGEVIGRFQATSFSTSVEAPNSSALPTQTQRRKRSFPG